jgi:hypothetical protein
MGMFYDLQSAMAAKPIYNSENHIIVDRDQRPIPPGHTYTAIWQGAIHGQGATTSWVWERTYDPKSDFAGSILHRPENVIAHGEAGLDLMRLAREVTALQQAPRQVALLYSVTSLIHDLSYLDVWARAYTALSFAGIAVGYRSERQAAAGDWGETRVLIVPAARYVTAPARAGIRRWGEAGGRVVFIGSGALGLDPHRRPFPDQPGGTVPASVLSVDLTEQALRDALLEAVQAAGCPLPLSVHGTDGRLPWGVEWRSCEAADGSLVNLINLTREPLTVRLGTSDTAWRDLISGRELPPDVALLPLRPVLALARR